MDKAKFHILLDNGHGSNTAGKCSPDMRIREYKYVREVVAGIAERLVADAYNVHIIVPETTDVSLRERCRRVNEYCKRYGENNCLVVSVHLNAMPPNDNNWHTARGWQACVALKCSINSTDLSACLYDAAEQFFKVRKPLHYQPYWKQDLAICRDTCCAAVLTENLFQDNREDVDVLLSADGFNNIVSLHVKGIQDYINNL